MESVRVPSTHAYASILNPRGIQWALRRHACVRFLVCVCALCVQAFPNILALSARIFKAPAVEPPC